MKFIAEELREYMAKLGIRTIDELVGRSDMLCVKERQNRKTGNTLTLAGFLITRLQEKVRK